MDALIPGRIVTCIFCFGIIEDFTETCSLLQEKVCVFINSIATIVHQGAHDYYGAANKNIGRAFLLAWKICDGLLPGLSDPRDPPGTRKMSQAAKQKLRDRTGICVMGTGTGTVAQKIGPQEMVDSALTAMLKVRCDVHTANKPEGSLRRFLEDKKIVEHFGADHEVHMGFGMHIGWATEGAIGSKFKIDASYLSPNVNMSARLEAATHQFGTEMLLSEWFVGELSDAARSRCRLIDKVCVKGSEVAMEIWTFDIATYGKQTLVPRLDYDGRQIAVSFSVSGVA